MGACTSSDDTVGHDTRDYAKIESYLSQHTSLLHILSPSELSAFARYFTLVDYVSGVSVCADGDVGRDFYAIVEGGVVMFVDEEKYCVKGVGDFMCMSARARFGSSVGSEFELIGSRAAGGGGGARAAANAHGPAGGVAPMRRSVHTASSPGSPTVDDSHLSTSPPSPRPLGSGNSGSGEFDQFGTEFGSFRPSRGRSLAPGSSSAASAASAANSLYGRSSDRVGFGKCLAVSAPYIASEGLGNQHVECKTTKMLHLTREHWVEFQRAHGSSGSGSGADSNPGSGDRVAAVTMPSASVTVLPPPARISPLLFEPSHTLASLAIFRGLPRRTAQNLGLMFTARYLRAGAVLFEELSEGREMYIVVDGSLHAFVGEDGANGGGARHDTPDTYTKEVRYNAGEIVGEISMLMKVPRTSTVRARNACVLMALSLSNFPRFYADLPVSGPLHKLLKRRTAEHFRSAYHVPFFAGIPDDQYIILAHLCNIEHMSGGQVVFNEGEAPDKFYIIVSGCFKVTIKRETEKSQAVAAAQAVVVRTSKRQSVMSSFVDLLKPNVLLASGSVPPTGSGSASSGSGAEECSISSNISALLLNTRSAAAPAPSPIPSPTAGSGAGSGAEKAQSHHAHSHSLSSNSSSASSSGNSNSSSIISSSHSAFLLDVDRELNRLHAGRYFGEVALVQNTPRTATVTAVGPSVVLSITKGDFEDFFAKAPQSIADFEVRLARYDVHLRSVLYHSTGLSYFERHLTLEYSSENLEFWKACRDFRHLARKDLPAGEESPEEVALELEREVERVEVLKRDLLLEAGLATDFPETKPGGAGAFDRFDQPTRSKSTAASRLASASYRSGTMKAAAFSFPRRPSALRAQSGELMAIFALFVDPSIPRLAPAPVAANMPALVLPPSTAAIAGSAGPGPGPGAGSKVGGAVSALNGSKAGTLIVPHGGSSSGVGAGGGTGSQQHSPQQLAKNVKMRDTSPSASNVGSSSPASIAASQADQLASLDLMSFDSLVELLKFFSIDVPREGRLMGEIAAALGWVKPPSAAATSGEDCSIAGNTTAASLLASLLPPVASSSTSPLYPLPHAYITRSDFVSAMMNMGDLEGLMAKAAAATPESQTRTLAVVVVDETFEAKKKKRISVHPVTGVVTVITDDSVDDLGVTITHSHPSPIPSPAPLAPSAPRSPIHLVPLSSKILHRLFSRILATKVSELTRTFNRYDEDRSGSIEFNEFQHICAHMKRGTISGGISGVATSPALAQNTVTPTSGLGTDAGQNLSNMLGASGSASAIGAGEAMLINDDMYSAFHNVDVDGSGSISLLEFISFIYRERRAEFRFQAMLRLKAREIYNMYISDQAARQVNINGGVQRRLKELLDDSPPSAQKVQVATVKFVAPNLIQRSATSATASSSLVASSGSTSLIAPPARTNTPPLPYASVGSASLPTPTPSPSPRNILPALVLQPSPLAASIPPAAAPIAKPANVRITQSIFDAAESEILKLMSSDSFSRFKQSALFQQFLNDCGAYNFDGKNESKATTPFPFLSGGGVEAPELSGAKLPGGGAGGHHSSASASSASAMGLGLGSGGARPLQSHRPAMLRSGSASMSAAAAARMISGGSNPVAGAGTANGASTPISTLSLSLSTSSSSGTGGAIVGGSSIASMMASVDSQRGSIITPSSLYGMPPPNLLIPSSSPMPSPMPSISSSNSSASGNQSYSSLIGSLPSTSSSPTSSSGAGAASTTLPNYPARSPRASQPPTFARMPSIQDESVGEVPSTPVGGVAVAAIGKAPRSSLSPSASSMNGVNAASFNAASLIMSPAMSQSHLQHRMAAATAASMYTGSIDDSSDDEDGVPPPPPLSSRRRSMIDASAAAATQSRQAAIDVDKVHVRLV